MNAEGFNCEVPSGDPQVSQVFSSANSVVGTLVRCGDFEVLLAPEDIDAALSAVVTCPSGETISSFAAEQIAVEGKGFLIISSMPWDGFPPAVTPEDFQKSFGGDQVTYGALIARGCGSAPVISDESDSSSAGAASPTASVVAPAVGADRTVDMHGGSYNYAIGEEGRVDVPVGTVVTSSDPSILEVFAKGDGTVSVRGTGKGVAELTMEGTLAPTAQDARTEPGIPYFRVGY